MHMKENPDFYTKKQAEDEGFAQLKELGSKFPSQGGNFTSEQYENADANLREKHIEMINRFAGEDGPAYLVGGYACDALINGDFIEPHTDIDLVATRKKQEELEEKLNESGYSGKKKIESDPEKPFKIFVKKGALQAEFALIDTDQATGEPYTTVKLENGKSSKLFFSSDMFLAEPMKISEKTLKVVSPRGLIQSLLFYKQIHRAGLREKDLNRVNALINKYFPGESLDSDLFKVRIEEIS